MAPFTLNAEAKRLGLNREMNADENTGNPTQNGDQLSPEDTCDSLKCGRFQTDEECKSGSSISLTEETYDDRTRISSHEIHVKDSYDVHIGDRTYFTIHQTTCSSGDELKKIIRQVVESPNIKTVLDVKTTSDQPGGSSGVFVQGFKLVKDADSRAANGTTQIILDSEKNDSVDKRNSSSCWPLANRTVIVIAGLIFVLVVSGVASAAVYLSQFREPTDPDAANTPEYPFSNQQSTMGHADPPEKPNVEGGSGIQKPNGRARRWMPVSRFDWGSWRPLANTSSLQHPIRLVVVAHTAGQPCSTSVQCEAKMRGLQDYSVGELQKPDIIYNFLVGHDGNAYEGVGWDVEATYSNKYRNNSCSIAYMGNYVHISTTPQQLQAVKNILALGVELKKLAPDYILVAHNLTTNTLSPGSFVYQQIKTLPHFTDDQSSLPI